MGSQLEKNKQVKYNFQSMLEQRPARITPRIVILTRSPKTYQPRNRSGESSARLALESASTMGGLDLGRVNRALDFGAGFGASTYALRCYLPENALVAAAEIIKGRAEDIVAHGILPRERVYSDGIAHLRSLSRKQGERYDLVTAFQFGGNEEEMSLFESLLGSCLDGLTNEGQILMTAWPAAFLDVMRYCKEHNIEFIENPGKRRTDSTSIPSTLHIPRASLG